MHRCLLSATVSVFLWCGACVPPCGDFEVVIVEDDDIFRQLEDGSRIYLGSTYGERPDTCPYFNSLRVRGLPTSFAAFDSYTDLRHLSFELIGFRSDERGALRRIPNFDTWRVPDGSFPRLWDLHALRGTERVVLSELPELTRVQFLEGFCDIESLPRLEHVRQASLTNCDLAGLSNLRSVGELLIDEPRLRPHVSNDLSLNQLIEADALTFRQRGNVSFDRAETVSQLNVGDGEHGPQTLSAGNLRNAPAVNLRSNTVMRTGGARPRSVAIVSTAVSKIDWPAIGWSNDGVDRSVTIRGNPRLSDEQIDGFVARMHPSTTITRCDNRDDKPCAP